MKKVTRKELIKMIENDKDYSLVDVSEISDFSKLFYRRKVVFDISNWNTSSAKNMSEMFARGDCPFPLGKWDVSNVTIMKAMFAVSDYNHPLNEWNVSSVKNMQTMFSLSSYNYSLEDWDVSSVKNMEGMFFNSKYNHPLNKWNIKNLRNTRMMFEDADYSCSLSLWDLSNYREKGKKNMMKNTNIIAPPSGLSIVEITKASYVRLTNEYMDKLANTNCARNHVDGCLLALNFAETDDFSKIKLDYDESIELIELPNVHYFIKQRNNCFYLKHSVATILKENCLK